MKYIKGILKFIGFILFLPFANLILTAICQFFLYPPIACGIFVMFLIGAGMEIQKRKDIKKELDRKDLGL